MVLLPALALTLIASAQTQPQVQAPAPASPQKVVMEFRFFTASAPLKVEMYDYVSRDDDNDSYVGSKTNIDKAITKFTGDKTLKQVSTATVHGVMTVKALVKAVDSLKEDEVELTPLPEDPPDTIHPHTKIQLIWNLKAGKDVEVAKTANTAVMLGQDRELLLIVPFNGSRMVLALTVKPEH